MENSLLAAYQKWVGFIDPSQGDLYANDVKVTVEKLVTLFITEINEWDKQWPTDANPIELLANIPGAYKSIGLNLRFYSNNCHSCIISDSEIELATRDILKELSLCCDDSEALDNLKVLIHEMLFITPFILKQAGLEVYRPVEQNFVNNKIAEKLARAIHARYSKLMLDIANNPEAQKIYSDLYIVDDKNQQYFFKDFDELPDTIKQSNIDNAYHIPTKLLAIGYGIKEREGNEDIPLLYLSDDNVETMAMVEHDRWSWEKRLNGYSYAPKRDDNLKKHDCLIPYDELTELEKEKDRILVRMIPSLLQDIGIIPYALDHQHTETIKYSQRALAKIHHVKHNAENLQKGIESLLNEKNIQLPLELKEYFDEIIDGSKEVGAAISSAGTIQKTYLPSTLFFKECLPDSFLLFKPKDIVSGDFYFVSKKFGAVIFIAADCTGHGIQGALLSAICYNYIDQAVNDKNITDPAAIIATVMPRVEYLMRRNEGNVENKSGMELAVCTYYPNSNLLFYAGLNRPLYYYSNNQLNELEPTKYRESIDSIVQTIETQIIKMNIGDTAYMFSDGFADQFGGERDNGGERFKTKRFKELLGNIQGKTMIEQREALNQSIEQWRQQAKQEQTDDIIVIGVKF